jgi:hypothetical protein
MALFVTFGTVIAEPQAQDRRPGSASVSDPMPPGTMINGADASGFKFLLSHQTGVIKGYLYSLGVDPTTKTELWAYAKTPRRCWTYTGGSVPIYGMVPDQSILADDELARSLVQRAGQLWLTTCRQKTDVAEIHLVPVDFWAADSGDGELGPTRVYARMWSDALGVSEYRLHAYRNHIVDELAAKRAEQARKEERERFAAMLRKKGVNSSVDLNDLRANPFPHVGKVIAICLNFIEMTTASQALLGHPTVVVSEVSSTLLTRAGAQIGVVGRIVGRIDIKGQGAVPHLKFVDTWGDAKACPGAR